MASGWTAASVSPKILGAVSRGSASSTSSVKGATATGGNEVLGRVSVFQGEGAPAWLAAEVQNLNTNTALQRSMYKGMLDRLFESVQSGANPELAAYALAAGMIQPGAKVSLAAPQSFEAQKTTAQALYRQSAPAAQQAKQQEELQYKIGRLETLQKSGVTASAENAQQLEDAKQRLQAMTPGGSAFGAPQSFQPTATRAPSGWVPAPTALAKTGSSPASSLSFGSFAPGGGFSTF